MAQICQRGRRDTFAFLAPLLALQGVGCSTPAAGHLRARYVVRSAKRGAAEERVLKQRSGGGGLVCRRRGGARRSELTFVGWRFVCRQKALGSPAAGFTMSGRVSPVLFFQNPMGEIDEQLVDDELFIDEDDLTPRAIESGSPGDIIRVLHTPPPFEDKEAERALAEFEHEMTDNELSDLTYAFQSCDIDGAGTIEPPELYAMMAVLGAEVDLKTVQLVMKESTHKFKGWLAAQQAKEAVAGLALPDELVHDEKESGHHGSTKHGGKRHHTELVELKKKHPLIVLGLHPLMTPVRVPMKYSAKIVYISGKVMAAPFEGLFKEEEEEYSGLSAVEKAAAIEAAMLSDQHMVFSEFMYMMGHREVLDNLVPGDWHKQADKMRKYRHAFGKAHLICTSSPLVDVLRVCSVLTDGRCLRDRHGGCGRLA